MADPTRLELATSAVTGQRSNQLSYESTPCYYNSLFVENQDLHARYFEGAGVGNLWGVDLVLHGWLGT